MKDETAEAGLDYTDIRILEPDGVSFFEALEIVVKRFGKIHRLAWGDKTVHVALHFDQLSLRKADGWHPWIISVEDIEAEDWRVWNHSGE